MRSAILPLVFALFGLFLACGGGGMEGAGAHATKPMSPAEGAADYEKGGVAPGEKPIVPAPEKSAEPSAQPGAQPSK